MKPQINKLLDSLGDKPEKEPALKIGTTTGTVAGIASLVLFIAPDLLSDRQLTIILIISAFVLPIISAIFTRGKVWSPATVQEVLNEAVKEAQEASQEINTKDPRNM